MRTTAAEESAGDTRHRPIDWFVPVVVPAAAVRDPRTRPGDLALLFGVHVVCLGCSNFECSIANERLAKWTGLRSPAALAGPRRNLEQWGYITATEHPERPAEYGCPVAAGSRDDVAVPALIGLDSRCGPAHIACYLALSVLAETTRRVETPNALYPLRLEAGDAELATLAGFAATGRLDRPRRDLAEWRLLEFTESDGSVQYELTASQAADQELRQQLPPRADSQPAGPREPERKHVPYMHSPAYLVVARQGVSLRTIARAMEVSEPYVSMQLAGLRHPHPKLFPVLRALVGPEAALHIERLIDTT